MVATYGYIRVNTKEQNEQLQLHKMLERGVEARRIFVDRANRAPSSMLYFEWRYYLSVV